MSIEIPVPETPKDLEQALRTLRMPHARARAGEILATAKAQMWEPAEVLRTILHEEITGRGQARLAANRKAAGFPTGKTFEFWDADLSSIPRPTQQSLKTLDWIGRAENLVLCGPSGTGKTFFLEALGQLAIEKDKKVTWTRLEDLGLLVRSHRPDDTVTKMVTKLLRADLIIIDDIGMLPVTADAAEGLYRLVDAAYEKRSLAITSNIHPAGFDEIMPKTIATALVDRLLHHAHICQTSGESIRLMEATAGQGVTTD